MEYGYLEQYYNTRDENARLISRHGSVEYRTTMRYIDQYVKPGSRILEVGAGTGRYSIALSRTGHHVTAVELIQHNIDVFKEQLKESDHIDIFQGNAMDFSGSPTNASTPCWSWGRCIICTATRTNAPRSRKQSACWPRTG